MTMAWVAAGTALVGAGASIYGSNKQAKGAEKAGNINLGMFDTLNRQQQPFIGGGYGAMQKLNTLLGINPNPNYRAPQMSPPPGPTGPTYAPTGSGGIQQRFGPLEDPSDGFNRHVGIPENAPNFDLGRLLTMRARNGDPQAQRILMGQV